MSNKDVQYVFNCGWNSVLIHLHRKYSIGFNIANPSTIEELCEESISFDDTNRFVVKYYQIDGRRVGLWYPTSNTFDFDACSKYMKSKYPTIIHTNELNLNHIYSASENDRDKLVGLIEFGSLFAVNSMINYLKGVRDEDVLSFEPMRSGDCITLIDNTTIKTVKCTIDMKKCVLWYISSSTGNVSNAHEYMKKIYPKAKHHNIDNFSADTLI